MATTLKSNLIIPEVIAAKVDVKLTDNMVFLPVAQVDSTLEGNPGDTIKFPKYAYIGDANDTDENGQVVPVALSESYVSATVKKITKAVQITDEARLSGHGDPVGEATSQIVRAIDNKTDNDILAQLETLSAARQYGTQSNISVDLLADALTIFGEDEAGDKALYSTTADVATLRKDDDFIKACDMGQEKMMRGTLGDIWGCNLMPANKVKKDTATGEIHRYIIKPGAIKLIGKRGTLIEAQREPEYMRDTIYASKHYCAYLYDESKVVMIRQFTQLNAPQTDAVTSEAGVTAANDTYIKITEAAPVGYRWVYKLGTANVTPTFGTALTGYTDWVSGATEIAASTNTKASVALVDADNKPVEHINLALTKKA